jgi:hypothetical protein
VGVTAGSREVPGRKPVTRDNNTNNNNNNNNIIIIIIIIIKKEKTCTLIDVAIPADRNVVQKKAEKKLTYKSLGTEIQRCGT